MTHDKNILSQDEILWGVYYHHNTHRKKHARDVDNAESARITNNPFLWFNDPSRNDFALVDTIVRQKPKGYSSSRGKSAYDEMMEFFVK